MFFDPSQAIDGGNPKTRIYEPLIERRVQFVPNPVKIKRFSIKDYVPNVPIPSFVTLDSKAEAFEWCLMWLERGISKERFEYSEFMAYKSGLNGNTI